MGKNLNMAEEILSKLVLINQKPFFEPEEKEAIQFMLTENLTTLLGKNEFVEDDECIKNSEFELVTTTDGIELRTIFSDDTFVVSLVDGNKIVMFSKENAAEFVISFGDGIVNNSLQVNADTINHYLINLNNQEFAYRVCEIVEGTQVCAYDGKLRSIFARHKESEVFELITTVPLEPKGTSFLKRVIDNVKNNNLVNIPTRNGSYDILEYTDVIFARLKEEANKKQNIQKKELR